MLLFSVHFLFAMSTSRASFTPDVVNTLFGILPDHVSPAGKKIDWEAVAATLKSRSGKSIPSLSIKNWFNNMKYKHKAWNELKSWTGNGLTENGCPNVDVDSEKWQAFVKVFRN